jgi:hypothetical protein
MNTLEIGRKIGDPGGRKIQMLPGVSEFGHALLE